MREVLQGLVRARLACAVKRKHHGIEHARAVFPAGERAEGHLAAAFQLAQNMALRTHACLGFLAGDGAAESLHALVARAHLDAYGTLPCGGNHGRHIDDACYAVA